MEDLRRLHLTLASGEVARFHTTPGIPPQTVAAHAWGVATLVIDLYNGHPSTALLREALFHDSAEIITGDIPASYKWCKGDTCTSSEEECQLRDERLLIPKQTLTPQETIILKLADMLEGLRWTHAHERPRVGCDYVHSKWDNAIVNYLRGNKQDLDTSQRVKVINLYVTYGGRKHPEELS